MPAVPFSQFDYCFWSVWFLKGTYHKWSFCILLWTVRDNKIYISIFHFFLLSKMVSRAIFPRGNFQFLFQLWFSLFVVATTPTVSTPYSFPVSLVEKLYNSNYLHWRQQVEPITKSDRLQVFVANPTISPQYPDDKDHYVDHMNSAYEVWEVQDQMLFTLLQSMLSKLILSCIIGDTLLSGFGHNSWVLLSLDKVPAWQLHTDVQCRCN